MQYPYDLLLTVESRRDYGMNTWNNSVVILFLTNAQPIGSIIREGKYLPRRALACPITALPSSAVGHRDWLEAL